MFCPCQVPSQLCTSLVASGSVCILHLLESTPLFRIRKWLPIIRSSFLIIPRCIDLVSPLVLIESARETFRVDKDRLGRLEIGAQNRGGLVCGSLCRRLAGIRTSSPRTDRSLGDLRFEASGESTASSGPAKPGHRFVVEWSRLK